MKKIFLLTAMVISTVAVFADNVEMYNINFKTTQGAWTLNNVILPDGMSFIWQQSSQYGMKASAFSGGTTYAAESWLVSAPLDMSTATAATFTFNQAMNKGAADALFAGCYVAITGDGENWQTITPTTLPTGTDWNFVQTENITIPATLLTNQFQIAFVYVSYSNNAPTWEISSVAINGDGTPIVEPEIPVEHITLAEWLEKKDPTTRYELTAVVTSIPSNFYGNLYIADGADTVYVYGLAYGEQNRSVVDSFHIEVGDTLTLSGMYQLYQGKVELVSGIYVDCIHLPIITERDMVYYPEDGHEFALDYLTYKMRGENDYIDSVRYFIDFFAPERDFIDGRYTIADGTINNDFTYVQKGSEATVFFQDGSVTFTKTGNTKIENIDGQDYTAVEFEIVVYLIHWDINNEDTTKTYYTKTIVADLLAIDDETDSIIEFLGEGPQQVAYFIKHPWGTGADADWTWKPLTYTTEEQAWYILDLWGGVGCNIADNAEGENASWFAAADIVFLPENEPAKGTAAQFVYYPADHMIVEMQNTLVVAYEETALEDVTVEGETAVKRLINGKLFIIRDGVTYDAQGAVVK